MSIKSWLRNWLLEPKGEEPPLPVDAAVSHYEASLSTLEDGADAANLLSVLVQRDQVATALEKEDATSAIVQRLVDLDWRLRQSAPRIPQAEWDAWRWAIGPPTEHWWWRLDEAEKEKAEKSDLVWVISASAMMTAALGLVVEIVGRLWGEGPDWLSTVVAIISLLLTGSPLTKRGRELAERFLSKVFRISLQRRGEAMFAMAAIALLAVLAIRFWGLPALALYYNRRGYEHLRANELTQARSDFQQDVSLNPDDAAAYYNLAAMYEQTTDYDSAVEFYTKALEHDLSFDLAYNNLGRVYILQKKYDQAVTLLRQGVPVAQDDETRYALHTNLGRAYYGMERYGEATAELQTAIALQIKDAVANCHLALVYEALEQPTKAIIEWKNCLRGVDQNTAEGSGWAMTAKVHLQELKEGTP